ncbi:MAG: hypothetical protein ACR2KT_16140 [Methylocella sp.]
MRTSRKVRVAPEADVSSARLRLPDAGDVEIGRWVIQGHLEKYSLEAGRSAILVAAVSA